MTEMVSATVLLRSDYQAELIVGMNHGNFTLTADETRIFVGSHFSQAIPDMLISKAAELGIDPRTPHGAIPVLNLDLPELAPVPKLWVILRLSETSPDETECRQAFDTVYDAFTNWLIGKGLVPEIRLDLLWGPTHGQLTIHGVEIEW